MMKKTNPNPLHSAHINAYIPSLKILLCSFFVLIRYLKGFKAIAYTNSVANKMKAPVNNVAVIFRKYLGCTGLANSIHWLSSDTALANLSIFIFN